MTMISARRFLLLAAILITLPTVVAAQSGRRSKTKPATPSTPPVTESQPAQPQQTESKPAKQADIQLIVGIEDPSVFSGVPPYLADTVLEECLRRLNEPAGISAKAGPRRMTRSDAIKSAKGESAGYVVWLQVGNEVADASRPTTDSADQFYVNYLILEPLTGKLKQSGRVEYAARKVGVIGVGAPPGRRSPAYSDYIIREEAREAADRILRAFGVRNGPLPR